MTKASDKDTSEATLSSDHAYDVAREKGLTVLLPKSNELLVDLDTEADYEVFQRNLDKFKKYVAGIKEEPRVWPSRSGLPGKRHASILLDRKIDDGERILFQLLLGSDQTREILSYARLHYLDDDHPTLFFESAK